MKRFVVAFIGSVVSVALWTAFAGSVARAEETLPDCLLAGETKVIWQVDPVRGRRVPKKVVGDGDISGWDRCIGSHVFPDGTRYSGVWREGKPYAPQLTSSQGSDSDNSTFVTNENTQRLLAERKEQERLVAERQEAERLAAQRKEQERLVAERQEAERLAAQRKEQERLVAERREAERLAAQRKEQERLVAERREAERLAAQRKEQERLVAERREAERLAAQRKEQERLVAERREAERLAAQRKEQERLVAERREAERLAAQRKEQERLVAERREAERLAAQRKEQERLVAERREAERLAAQQKEQERLLAERRKRESPSVAANSSLTVLAQNSERESAVSGATGNQSIKRSALVIGNSAYAQVPKLKNAQTDAQAIAKTLRKVGFEVILRLDQDDRGLRQAVRDWVRGLPGGSEAVFYFAGHGVQLGAANYLLPVNITADDEEQVKDDGLPLQRVLDDLTEQRVRISLAIIDACRDNPFPRRLSGRSIGATRGLAPTTAATGQMILFSAGAGQSALDNLGPQDKNPNGLFTRILLKQIETPGVPVDQVLKRTRVEVVALANQIGHEQVPALYDQTVGDYFLIP